MDHFKDAIKLDDIAGVAAISIPAFCNYFKKSTKKNYIDFLNEIRIGFACNLLIENKRNITEACYQSGFYTVANFNKQFLKVKGMTPSSFKKQISRSTACN
jgi:AraC-like DNA-binding protein